MIRNPILPGFNPDPSICRVGEDYYIATSTFEWYPGVQIHHSRDLVNWRLVKRPLDRASQLDMRGDPDSCGIWAPCLSFADGKFWLVYTDVKRYDGNFKDAHNYIVTAPAIEGPWSDPVYANSSGFDPSLFHDDDGRKWFLNMHWNHRTQSVGGKPKHPAFAGIVLQEFDAKAGRLVGPARNIFAGSAHGLVEGPHLYKRNGWYYMTVAEGGTGYDHAVTMARSRNIEGPYELHPNTFLITSKDAPEAPLQRAGHGQIVETAGGLVYHTHLVLAAAARHAPLAARPRNRPAKMRLEGRRLALSRTGRRSYPPSTCRRPMRRRNRKRRTRYDANSTARRCPTNSNGCARHIPTVSSRSTGKSLRLHARELVGSWFEQALVGRRQEHWSFRAETRLDFAPQTLQQVAGLAHYYNRYKFHFLGITWHEKHPRCLTILSCPGEWPDGRLQFPLAEPVPLPPQGPVELAMAVDKANLQFFWRAGGEWKPIGPVLDASVVSDEGGTRGEHGSFTGAFAAMIAFDIGGTARPADFFSFDYSPG